MEANQTKTYQDNNKWFSDVTQKMYFFSIGILSLNKPPPSMQSHITHAYMSKPDIPFRQLYFPGMPCSGTEC